MLGDNLDDGLKSVNLDKVRIAILELQVLSRNLHVIVSMVLEFGQEAT